MESTDRIKRLTVALFDRPRCRTADGELAFPARPKARTLFVALCLAPQALDRDVLAARFWPDEPDRVARANLRRHVGYVEQWLARATGCAMPIVRTRGRLAFDPALIEWLDVRAFREAVASGAYEEAAASYGGELLVGLDDDWIVAEREQLRALYDDVLHRLVTGARARNETETALRYARAARATDPYNEAWLRTTMRVRYASGDRAGALREYDTFSALLKRELDLDPMPETLMLADSIRRLEYAVAPSRLAVEATSFVGRAVEQRQLAALIEHERFVCVTGEPGAGKSRLSLRCVRACAERRRDGAIIVDAGVLSESTGLERSVTRALEAAAGAAAGSASLEELAARLDAVVLFDGCERHTAACADLVRRLLHAGPGLRIVASSRIALGVAGEVIVRVGPLPAGDALALFIERLRMARPHWEPLTADLALAERICGRLDGLPLAIELAAARGRVSTLDQVLRDVSHFTGRPGFALLDATFQSSYELLSAKDRAVLRRLSAFATSWSVPVALAACADIATAKELHTSFATLVEHSLVVPPAAGEVGATYTMLDATRDFALSRVRALGEEDAVAQAHAHAVARHYVAIGPRLRAERAVEYYDDLERDRDNIEAALATLWTGGPADRAEATDLSLAVSRFWADQGFARQGEVWLRRSLADSDETEAPKRLEILRVIGILTRDLGDYRASFRDFAELVDLLRESHASVVDIAKAQTMAANAARMTGDFDEALRRLQEARAAFSGSGETYHAAWSTYAIGTTLLSAGRFAEAKLELHGATDAFNDLGAVSDSSSSIANLSLAYYYEGAFAVAHELTRESVARASAAGHRYYYAHAVLNEASILHGLGRPAEAQQRVLEASSLATELHALDVLISCAETACAVLSSSAPGDAAVLLGSVESARERAHAPRFPVDLPGNHTVRQAVIAELGDERFTALEARGRVTPLRAAVAALPGIFAAAKGVAPDVLSDPRPLTARG